MKIFFSILLLSIGSVAATAQTQPLDWKVGIQGGFGGDQQLGWFKEACGCSFKGASGFTSSFAGIVELRLNHMFSFGLRPGIDFLNVASTTGENGTGVVVSQMGQDTISGLDIRTDATTKLTYFTLSPYASFHPLSLGLFLQAGPSVSILTSSDFTQTHRIVAPAVRGETEGDISGWPRFASTGTPQETVEDQPIDNANKIMLSAIGSIGWEIPVFGATLVPMANYTLPLTTIRNANQSGWKITSITGTLALKFGI